MQVEFTVMVGKKSGRALLREEGRSTLSSCLLREVEYRLFSYCTLPLKPIWRLKEEPACSMIIIQFSMTFPHPMSFLALRLPLLLAVTSISRQLSTILFYVMSDLTRKLTAK